MVWRCSRFHYNMVLKNLHVIPILPSHFSSWYTWKHWFKQEQLEGTIITFLKWDLFLECLYFSEYDIRSFLAVFLSYSVLFFCFNLTFIQKRCAPQKLLFFSHKINFCCKHFLIKIIFWTKVSQNAFNFNQIEC